MTAATAAVASWGGVVSDAGAYGSSGSSAAAGVGEVFFRGASSSGVEGVRKVPVIWASAAILCVSWWFAVETVVLIAMFAGGRVRRRVLAVDAP
ncbi:hypothetical protein HK100_006729 [Physocladia obscura]|uniref:Uncharacterized protein n=1 Tax=Physocladia obscura TaxID=109957 RepID=A0AAD5T7U7_9FUNG|nr:hypothetical protein HK100_006729 [Physocladia obscura]